MTLEGVAGAGSFIVGLVARQLLDGMHYLCARQDHILSFYRDHFHNGKERGGLNFFVITVV